MLHIYVRWLMIAIGIGLLLAVILFALWRTG
ncbi:hypothetical protein BH23CHL5_BH23CHL5_14640 [soil metagenome]